MAEIPRYSSSQVQESALPAVREQSAVTPEALARPAEAQVRMGGALLDAGTGINAVAYQMQEKENVRSVQQATAAYGERVLNYQIDVKKNRTGTGAVGVTNDFSDFHKKTIEELERGLGNPAQREAFRAITGRTGLSTRREIASFEIGETNKANISADEATAQKFIDLGAVAVDDATTAEHRKNLEASTRAFAAAQGMPKQVEDQLVGRRLTAFHAQRIQNLAQIDPENATKYFKANQHEIDGSKRAEIGEFANKATAEGLGVRAGGEIMATMGPTKDNQPFELDKMEEAARQRFKDNPLALKATIANLRERRAAFETSRDSRAEAVQGKVNQAILDGASLGQVRGMPEFIALPGKVQLQIAEHLENRMVRSEQIASARESRADAAESRRERRLTREAYPAVLALMTQPERLAAMSKDQVLNMLPNVGVEHTKNLLSLQEKFKSNQAALSEGKIDNEDFKMIAMGAGFDVEKAKGDDARRLVGLKSAVETQIGLEQQRAGGHLPRERKVEIMQRVIDNAVMVDRTFLPDPKRPVSTVTANELKNAYVVVDDKEVKLSSIPATDRQQIITALQRRNLPVSEEAIARTWLRGNKPKDGLK